MPRPVVPIWFLPRKRSETLSIATWYDAITWAFALTTSCATSTPRSIRPSSSEKSASGETTTPLAITDVAPGVRMPDGSRWVAYFSPLTTMVWPALWPPLVRTTKSIGWLVASRSVALPLPSSPHWAPRTTIAGMCTPLRAWFSGRVSAGCAGLDRTLRWSSNESPACKCTGLLRPHATKSGARGLLRGPCRAVT
jgi:hypothetical protein